MKKLVAVTVDTVERELYFNKQKTKHEKCFIKHICERWVRKFTCLFFVQKQMKNFVFTQGHYEIVTSKALTISIALLNFE